MRDLTKWVAILGASMLVVACGVESADLTGAHQESADPGGSSDVAQNSHNGGSAEGGDTGGGDWGGGTTGTGGDGAFGGTTGQAGGEPTPVQPPVNPAQGDNFEYVGTNPFVMTAHDPQSTFAADVDTASYDIFRRDVGQGWLPQKESVRLEEWINAFSYDYDKPTKDSEAPFTINLEAAPSATQAGVDLVKVGIQGMPITEMGRKEVNLVFLIDTSGSMNGAAKLPLVKRVLMETVEVLKPTDRVAIVTYAGSAGVRLESTELGDGSAVLGVLSSLKSGGSTAGAAGIQGAYDQAEKHFIEGGINHVILCTDGDFNVGTSGTNGLVELIEEKRETGITFTALGFGSGNLNDIMMEKVSNAGNGTYSVIIDEDHAVSYAHQKMLNTLYFIAKDVKLQVSFNPEKVLAYRQLGYEINAIPDELFLDDTVDAGEIGAGHSVTALYEIVRMDDAIPAPENAPEVEDGEAFDGELAIEAEDLLRVSVRYKAPGATVDDPASELDAALLPGDVLADMADASDDLRWAAGVAAFAEILKDSPFARPDQLEAIQSLLSPETTDGEQDEFFSLMTDAILLLP